MTFRTVCKELVRTPVKTLLFLVLLALSTALLVLGVNLYISCQEAKAQVSANYKTVGTVRQKPDSVKSEEEVVTFSWPWEDPYAKYTVSLPDDLFDSLPTKLPVENRPTIVTTGEDTPHWSKTGEPQVVRTPERLSYASIITFQVTEEVDTDNEEFMSRFTSLQTYSGIRFKVNIEISSMNGEPCEKPLESEMYWPIEDTSRVVLHPGVEYIAASYCYYAGVNGLLTHISSVMLAAEVTYIDKGGMEYAHADQIVYENNDEFAGTEAAAQFERLIQSSQNLDKIKDRAFITVPTQSLDLLMPFYQDRVSIKSGREITEEEFASGAKVCMISEDFLTPGGSDPMNPDYINLMSVGDKLHLTWYGSIYGNEPAYLSPFMTSMSAPQSGVSYEPVADEEYEIVGIYYSDMQYMDYETNPTGRFGALEVIVPSASYDFESLPLLYGGPIQPGACSFELENGTGTDFLMALEKLEYSDLVQVELNDKGYAAIAKGLDAIALLAAILLLAGGASALCLLLFFVYLQIARRQREAAIQISLGAGLRRSAAFLLLSVLLVAVIGIAAGTCLGHVVTDQVSTQVYTQAKESGFSREYSDQFEASSDKAYEYDGSAQWPLSAGAGLAALGTALVLSAAFTIHSLRREPLEQLTRKD